MLTREQLNEIFGIFDYSVLPNGQIVIDHGWVNKWITKIEVPLLEKINCNVLIAEKLKKIFKELSESNDVKFLDIQDTKKIGGCWVPRLMYCNDHKRWDSCRGISRHSYGLAIDINPTKNPYGQEAHPNQYQIEKYFTENGFEWGQNWKVKDPMHWELDQINR